MPLPVRSIPKPEPEDVREDAPPDPSAPRPFTLLTGDDLPSGRTAEAIGWSGRTRIAFEKSMQTKVVTDQMRALDRLVLDCTPLLDGKKPTERDIASMHTADWRAQLLRIRRRSYPNQPTVAIKWHCAPPQIAKAACCDAERLHPMEQLVDLDAVQTVPAILPSPLVLPVAGRTVTYEPPTAAARDAYQKLRRGDNKVDTFNVLLSRGVTLDGDLATAKDLGALLGEDLDAITERLKQVGGPDTTLIALCERCALPWETQLEALPGFFFPTAGR